MYTIKQKCRVEAAHQLPKHEGKCKNLHGHSYAIEVELCFENGTNKKDGMFVDFGDIKQAVDTFDHCFLNEHRGFKSFINGSILLNDLETTAENFSKVIWHEVFSMIKSKKYASPVFIKVTVREGLGAHWVTYESSCS